MAKFKVELEIQGFKLKMEGEREDIPLMAQNLSEQVDGLIEPAANIAEGEVPRKKVGSDAAQPATVEVKSKTKRKRPRRTANGDTSPSGNANGPAVLNWTHSPEKWGNPLQAWTTAEKCLWLLYVVENELATTEMTGSSIAATFNRHFKQAKTVHPPNVTRDLGKLKARALSEVGENTTVTPTTWYLTDTGKARAITLVEAALGKSETAAS